MKYALALVAALGLAGCCSTPAPQAAPKAAAPCAQAAPVKAPSPFGCNAPAVSASPTVPMSSLTMPTPVAKALAVPPGVVTCTLGFLKCLVETLISPLKP